MGSCGGKQADASRKAGGAKLAEKKADSGQAAASIRGGAMKSSQNIGQIVGRDRRGRTTLLVSHNEVDPDCIPHNVHIHQVYSVFFQQFEGDEKMPPTPHQTLTAAVVTCIEEYPWPNETETPYSELRIIAGGSICAKEGDIKNGLQVRWSSGQVHFGEKTKRAANDFAKNAPRISDKSVADVCRDLASGETSLETINREIAEQISEGDWKRSSTKLCRVDVSKAAFDEISAAQRAMQRKMAKLLGPEVTIIKYMEHLENLWRDPNAFGTRVCYLSAREHGAAGLTPQSLALLADRSPLLTRVKLMKVEGHTGLLQDAKGARSLLALVSKFPSVDELDISHCNLTPDVLELLLEQWPPKQSLKRISLDQDGLLDHDASMLRQRGNNKKKKMAC